MASQLEESTGNDLIDEAEQTQALRTRVPPQPSGKMAELIDDDTYGEMFTFPSVDKNAYFTRTKDQEFGDLRPMNATVFLGDFISQFSEKNKRFFRYRVPTLVGGVFKVIGVGLEEIGERISPEPDIFDTFGSTLRNLGTHLTVQSQNAIAERERILGVEGTPGAFASDAFTSILSVIGVATTLAIAAPGVGALAIAGGTANVFGIEAGLSTISEGIDAGADHKKSLAWGLFNGLVTKKLELMGLNKIFGRTFVKGINFTKRRILTTIGIETGTEGLQQLSDVGAGFGTGARTPENTTFMDVLGEVVYAGALGMFVGGAMVSAIAIPQRAKAIKMLKSTGMSHDTAKATVDSTMQETADSMMKDVGADFGFDEVANKAYNKVNKKVEAFFQGLGQVTREETDALLDEATAADPAVQLLNTMRAETEAEIRGEEAKGVRAVPRGDIDKVQEDIEAGKVPAIDREINTLKAKTRTNNPTSDAGFVNEAIDAAINSKDEIEFSRRLQELFVIAPNIAMNNQIRSLWKQRMGIEERIAPPVIKDPVFDPSTPEVTKLAVRGRVKFINDRLKAILKNTKKNRKLLNIQIDSGIDTKTIQGELIRDFNEAVDLTAESNVIREDPDGVKLEGEKIVLKDTDLARATAQVVKRMARQAEVHFRAGRSQIKAEALFLRAALNKLINAPGLRKSTRDSLKQRFGRTSLENLVKQVVVIKQAVEDAQNDTAIPAIQKGIQDLVSFFKGTTKVKSRMDAVSQKIADVFVKEYEDKDTDPNKAREKLDGSRESKVRFLAAQLATGKDGVGQDLTAERYSEGFEIMNDLAVHGKESKMFADETRKRVKQKERELATEEILAGETETDQIFGNSTIGDRMLATVRRGIGMFHGHISMFVRHIDQRSGNAFTKIVTDMGIAERKATILRLYYVGAMTSLGKESFNIDTDKKLADRLREDANRAPGSLISVTQEGSEVTEGGIQKEPDKPVQVLSKAEAREKYMVSLRPEGRIKMLKTGWTKAGINNLVTPLTVQDIDYVMGQLKLYSEMYTDINNTYFPLTGMTLARGQGYNPLITDLEMIEGESMIGGLFGLDSEGNPNVNAESFLQPITKKGTELVNIPDFTKMSKYIADVSHYVGTAQTMDRVINIFKNPKVRKAIKSRFGPAILKVVDRNIDVLVKNSVNDKVFQMSSTLNKGITRFSEGVLAGKAIQLVKQVTSSFASMSVTTPKSYFKHLAEMPAAIESGEIMKLINDPYFKGRYIFRTQSKDIMDIHSNLEFDNQKSFIDYLNNPKASEYGRKLNRMLTNPNVKNFFTIFTQLGDLGGVLGSTFPLYKWYQSEAGGGFSEAEARIKAFRNADDTQQSGSKTNLSPTMLTANPLYRAMSLFKQAPLLYMNKVIEVFNDMGTVNFSWDNSADVKRFANVYITFMIVLPQLFEFVSNGFQVPDLEEEGPDFFAQLLLGPFDDVPLAGPLLHWAVAQTMASATNKMAGLDLKARPLWGTNDLIGSYFRGVSKVQKAIAKVFDDEGPDALNVTKAITEFSKVTLPVTGGFGGVVAVVGGATEGILLASEGVGLYVDNWRRYLTILGTSVKSTEPREV